MTTSTKPEQMLFRFRPSDTTNGVSRKTLVQIAKTLGFTETQVVHYAIKRLAKEVLPAYEPDEGDITPETIAVIKACVPQGKSKSVKSSLF